MKPLLLQAGLTQARGTCEETASVKEVPSSDWPVDKFLGHFLDSLLTWEDPVYWVQVVLGCLRRQGE